VATRDPREVPLDRELTDDERRFFENELSAMEAKAAAIRRILGDNVEFVASRALTLAEAAVKLGIPEEKLRTL
jgi:hypothetical protein